MPSWYHYTAFGRLVDRKVMSEDPRILVFSSLNEVMARAEEFVLLVSEALGVRQPIEKTLRQINFNDGETVIVAGEMGGELATMNAFIGHRFNSDDCSVLTFQSGFSATLLKHRGKGLWPKLLVASESILAELNGQWIFGFPNPVSLPLFQHKLSYSTLNMLSLRLPTIAISSLPSSKPDLSYTTPDFAQLSAWKYDCDAEKYVIIKDEKLQAIYKRKQKFGMGMLDIGAFGSASMSVPEILHDLKQTDSAAFVRLEVNEDSQYAKYLKMKKVSRPVIVKEIGNGVFPRKVDIFGGLADDF